jgi:hypothetical protein
VQERAVPYKDGCYNKRGEEKGDLIRANGSTGKITQRKHVENLKDSLEQQGDNRQPGRRAHKAVQVASATKETLRHVFQLHNPVGKVKAKHAGFDLSVQAKVTLY